jgi:hypothetical protein
MTINWAHFTPWESMTGGIVFGLASALFMLVSMADGQPKVMLFVAAMLIGMLGFELMDRFVHAPRKAKLNAA